MITHQYIERRTARVKTEALYQDPLIIGLYQIARERAPLMFQAATSGRMSKLLGVINYDLPALLPKRRIRRMIREMDIDLDECLDDPEAFRTVRHLFERRIRYWECRPMPAQHDAVVAPADAKLLIGECTDHTLLFIKEKFFSIPELLGKSSPPQVRAFEDGCFAILRLTPEKYHYNHAPVTGCVDSMYTVDGRYHSCNPAATVFVAAPYDKNRRVVTIINTDVPGGTGVGRVAMVEVVAMMIGDIVQCYSDFQYEAPREVIPGMFLKKGQPKSLFRPGSSTVALLFEKDRIEFDADIRQNLTHPGATSRYAIGLGRSLVETDVDVRSRIAIRRKPHDQ